MSTSSSPKISDWLATATVQLEAAGIGTARLDALVLLEDELGQDKSWILANQGSAVQGQSLYKLNNFLARRQTHEPLSYIRGKVEFYGRDFYVDARVLEPRPESETMIGMLSRLRLPVTVSIADVGAGSGALGITAYHEIPRSRVDFFDIDPATLEVAEQNAKSHRVLSRFFHSDLLLRATKPYEVVLANLPYVPARYQINQAASREPAVAIFGGGDGLALYRRLFTQLASSYIQPRYVLTESLPFQHAGLQIIAEGAGFKFHRHQDFIQVFESY
jgi:release factor glutamine methyltransferase